MELLDETYWSTRYINNDAGWDIGKPSPPLKAYIDTIADKSIAILIPGCGNAYEAAYLLEQGFTNLTLIDLSPLPLQAISERLHQYLGKSLTVICGDFFCLKSTYDLILEQTFFCAINPLQRTAYVHQMHALLNKTGLLAGVLFNRSFEGGPPFGGSKDEYQRLFSEKFVIKKMIACYNSIEPRKGTELFIEMTGK